MASKGLKIDIESNIVPYVKAKVYFPTEDGMAIGKPVVNIWFGNNRYLEISADDFERINVQLKQELQNWRELNEQ